jgi:glycosyltransferase involved in cell wall biosynthesis
VTGRIRVARIITRLNVGGPAIQAMTLTARLDADRFESLLIAGRTSFAEADMREHRPERGLEVVEIPALGREIVPVADLKAFVRLVSLLRSWRPDVVHTHMAKAGLLGRVAARLAGVPVVIHTFHGNVLQGYFGRSRSLLFLTLERILARLSTKVISISPQQTAELTRLRVAPPDRIVEIPLGFDLAPFFAAGAGTLRRELGLADDVPLIGTVARLVPIKGVDVFIDSAALVAAERTDAMFVIVGGGELAAALRERAAHSGLAERVRFLGWRADIASILADLDVFVLSSHNEGTPVSVIEALAAGRAVVATDVGGTRDILGDPPAGRLVPAGDAAGISRAVLELLSDDMKRATLGRLGRQRATSYDIRHLLDRIAALYASLVAREDPAREGHWAAP